MSILTLQRGKSGELSCRSHFEAQELLCLQSCSILAFIDVVPVLSTTLDPKCSKTAPFPFFVLVRPLYRKTPLISMYVISGLAIVQVLIFGAVFTFGGYKAEAKILQGRSLFNLVLSVDKALLCMVQRLWTYFQDTGVLIFGGMYFRGIAADSKFL